MFAALLSGPNEFSSKRIRLLMVDCWIECCNSDHLVKYLGSQFVRDETDKECNGQLLQYKRYRYIHRSVQQWDIEWIKAGGCFTGENVSRAFTNSSVKVTATELFFSNTSVYIEVDTCLETGKQVIFQNLNFLMSNNIDFFNINQLAWDIECIIAGDEAHNNNSLTGENVS